MPLSVRMAPLVVGSLLVISCGGHEASAPAAKSEGAGSVPAPSASIAASPPPPSSSSDPAASDVPPKLRFRQLLREPPKATEGEVKGEDGGGLVRYRIKLPGSFKDNDAGKPTDTRLYSPPDLSGCQVAVGTGEPMTLALQLSMAGHMGRTILEKRETADGFVIKAVSKVVVEVLLVRRAGGKSLLCRASVTNDEAVKDKATVVPQLEAICASLELK